MCLIVGKGCGVDLPKEKHLKNANNSNSDGIGVAYWKYGSNEVVIKKDFKDFKKFLIWYLKNLRKKDAFIIHFRVATSGNVDMGNRHPFPLTKNWKMLRKLNLSCQVAMAHNGVLGEYSFQNTKFSDTQKFIVDILSDDAIKNNLFNNTIIKLINKFIDNDRLAFLNSSGKMLFLGEFEKEKGIFYSNLSYKYTPVLLDGEDEPVSIKVCKINDNSLLDTKEKRIFGKCELCLKKKFVRYYYHTETAQSYNVCVKCEKKLDRGDYDKIKKMINKKEDTIQCQNCLFWFNETEIVRRGDNLVCIGCMKKHLWGLSI